MPLYDYKCNACDHKYEAIKSMSSKGPYKCPKCGAKRVARVFSPGNVSIQVQHEPGSARLNRGRVRR